MVNSPMIKQLLEREPTGKPVLSLYLDMAVGPDNKRSHLLFLNKQRARPRLAPTSELGRDGRADRARALRPYRAVARYRVRRAEPRRRHLRGDRWRVLPRHPTAAHAPNRVVLHDRPLVAPLAEALENERRWAILLVDRESLQLISAFLDQVEAEQVIAPEAAARPPRCPGRRLLAEGPPEAQGGGGTALLQAVRGRRVQPAPAAPSRRATRCSARPRT